MTIKISLPVVMAASLLLGAGCRRDDPAPTGSPDQSGTTGLAIQPGNVGQANPNAVATYPDMVPQSGTKQLLQPFTVYQAADTNSNVLSRVSVGQWINLKASRGNWMLIEWPSGVGQVSPGWIELRGGASDNRLSQSPPATAAATVPSALPTAPAIVDAGVDASKPTPDAAPPTPTPDAGTTAPPKPTGRGVTLKPRH